MLENTLTTELPLAPCPDDVTNLANGLLCSDCDWPSPTGVVFQTITATF